MVKNRRMLHLVADVGGTNVRFALAYARDAQPVLFEERTYPGADFLTLLLAIEHYLREVGVRPARAAIAVASPLAGDVVTMTNSTWSFSRTELAHALGVQKLMVLNDFGAVAWAMPALARGERETLQGDPDAPLAGPVSVIGPGTGLGVALLVEAGGWHVIETEGGHASFAALDDDERAIQKKTNAAFGRTSNERLLSGPGLAQIAGTPRRDPAEIMRDALVRRDPAAKKALNRFCSVLGSVAGDIALIHGARTVMIAGGIVPRFLPFLQGSEFREHFCDKGRFREWMERVTIHVVKHPQPGLLGAAMALRARAASL